MTKEHLPDRTSAPGPARPGSRAAGLVIASDIFGHTPALDRLADRLANRLTACLTPPGRAVEPRLPLIISPHDTGCWFRDEAAAYAHFCALSGIPAYGRKIADQMAGIVPPLVLVGFSAGASALWHISGDPSLPQPDRAVLFYGSQIRNYPEIRPAFDLELIFPRMEPHFDVDSLMAGLTRTPGVSCTRSSGLHGFMNEYSKNYDARLCQNTLETLF